MQRRSSGRKRRTETAAHVGFVPLAFSVGNAASAIATAPTAVVGCDAAAIPATSSSSSSSRNYHLTAAGDGYFTSAASPSSASSTIFTATPPIASLTSRANNPSYPTTTTTTTTTTTSAAAATSNSPSTAACPRRTIPSLPTTTTTTNTHITTNTTSPSCAFLPSHANVMPDSNPSYPSPNLYDLVLALNADPGLDNWWAHVVAVLHNHYGAERATLTVPGDKTDLQNVPWGQKATYSAEGYEAPNLLIRTYSHHHHHHHHHHGHGHGHGPGKSQDYARELIDTITTPTKAEVGRRKESLPPSSPSVVSADKPGVALTEDLDNVERDTQRTPGPEYLLHTSTTHQNDSPNSDEGYSDTPTEATISPTTIITTKNSKTDSRSKQRRSGSHAVVFPVPRELETEENPLIKRVGVVKLLGRTSPIVLTREYSNDPAQTTNADDQASLKTTSPATVDVNQATPSEEPVTCPLGQELASLPAVLAADSTSHPSRSSSSSTISSTATNDTITPTFSTRLRRTFSQLHHNLPSPEPYEDYEQPSPSPWSQSPAPSPAPLISEEENPFFVDPHKVDERAFASSPSPTHDYSQVDSVPAIGTNSCKTIIHIPLLHTPSLRKSPDTIRFPLAIVSILTSIVPYPQNLRQSLAFLLPHLTTSFSLAQQYTNLEKQLSASSQQRLGHILGLGGTFSDASSELELVAELSGQAHAFGSGGGAAAAAGDVGGDGGGASSNVATDGNGSGAGEDPAVRSSAESALSSAPSTAPPEAKLTTKAMTTTTTTNTTATLTRILSTPTESLHEMTSLDPLSVGGGGLGITRHDNEFLKSQVPVFAASRSSDHISNDIGGHAQLRKGSTPSTTSLSSSVHESQSTTQRPRSSSTGQFKAVKNVRLEEAALAHEYSNVRLSLPVPTTRHASSSSLATVSRDIYTRPFPDTVAQLILNSIPLHLFLAKPKTGEVIWTNAKFDAYRGGQQEQRLRDPFMNVHEEDRPVLEEKWADVLKQGPQGTVPCRVRSCQNNAGYRHFIFRANPLLSSNGEALYWIGSFLDVHEQRLREMEALSEREKLQADAKYRAFTNSIPQIVFEAGEHRGLISVNDQWHLYTGQPVDDALNLGFIKFIHAEDLAKCMGFWCKSLSESLSNEDQKEGEESNQQHHSQFQQQQRIAVSENQGGSRRSDTTVDFNTEEPTRQTPHRSKSGTRDGEENPLLARGITSLLHEVMNTGLVKMQRDENGRDFYITEIRLKSRLGEFRWHLVRLVKVDSFGHGEASWYGTCTDINDHKILEQSFNTAMEKLNIEMESKTKFFSNMSHEIRTPLNGILGTIPFLLDTQLDNEQRRMLDTIHNSSMNLRELVDNILDVSKVEAGKMNLVQQWFHLRSVLEDVMDTIGSRAIDRGLELNYLVDSGVPSMIIGDRFRIRQILINLVGNAVKFTSQGEIYTHCSIYKDPDAKLDGETELFINFDVVDTGKGFSKEEAKILMERFSQAQGSVGSQQGGTGLGLFLSKQLVEMHGGKLTPWSEGRGAKFSFYVKVGAPPPLSSDDTDQLPNKLACARDLRVDYTEASPKSQSSDIPTQHGSSKSSIGTLPPPINELQGYKKHFDIS
ncbi:hypothetical protein KEM54_000274, partial [Ascosphaera aggregata]